MIKHREKVNERKVCEDVSESNTTIHLDTKIFKKTNRRILRRFDDVSVGKFSFLKRK